MRAAQLDTKIVIQYKVLARDPTTKAQTWTWGAFVTRWARVEESTGGDGGGGEMVRGQVLQYARPTRILMRYVEGVTSAMRVVRNSDGRIFRINGVAVIGRNVDLRLTCTDWSMENEAAGP
jgi:head-tail adaptor